MSARTLIEQGISPGGEDDVVRVPDSRRDWRRFSVLAAIVAIVGVAVIVRFMHLTALGFNSDEAVYTGQAGSLAGVGAFGRSFSPFRAHPLLLQTVLAIEFLAFGHMSEYASRATVALLGVASVFATYRIGSRLYGVPVGLAAAAGLAIMPYHVFISRQVLLDVPAGLFVLLAFGALYRYDGVETRRWLYLAGALAGVACVIKETMVIFFPAAVLYLFWEKLLRHIRWRDGIVATVLMGIMLAPFVGTRFLFSGSSAGGYVIYQLFRSPNHPIWYFPVVFWIFITPLAVLAVVGGIVLACMRRTRADKLLVSWLAVFGLFFQFWPTKLLPYAIILTPAMALVGARGVLEAVRAVRARWSLRVATIVGVVAAAAILVPMIRPTWKAGDVIRDSSFTGPLHDRRRGAGLRRWPRGRDLARSAHALQQRRDDDGPVARQPRQLLRRPRLLRAVGQPGSEDAEPGVSTDPERQPGQRDPSDALPVRRVGRIHGRPFGVLQHAVDVVRDEIRRHPGVQRLGATANDVQTGRVAPALNSDGETTEVRIVVYRLVGGDPLSDAPPEVGN